MLPVRAPPNDSAVPHIAARLPGGSNRGTGEGAPLLRATHLFASVDLVKPDRKAWQRQRGERVLRPPFHNRGPTAAPRFGVDPGDAFVGVDDPVLSHAVARVQWRFQGLVVREACSSNLDDELGFAGVELSESARRFPEQLLGKDGDIRLKQDRIGQAQRGRDADRQIIRQCTHDCDCHD